MKQGLTPSDTRKDSYISMRGYDKFKHDSVDWRPHNANGRFSNAEVPLRSAFARSINTIAVKLGQEMGISNVIQTAQDMGIKSPLDNNPSLALGSNDVNLLELVNAYGTVADDGMHVDPVFITKIVDSDGNVIFENKLEETRALSKEAAFYMQKLLEASVYDAGGTSQPIAAGQYLGPYMKTLSIGGKTGTSNNHSDAWFVGVTPSLVAGAWVGGEYRSIHFRTGALGQGSRTALPIVAAFFRGVMDEPALRGKYQRKYGMPPTDIDASSYEATYVPQAAENDSLSNDSTAASYSEFDDDLMGGEGSTEETHPNHEATEPTEHSSHNKDNSSSSTTKSNSNSSSSTTKSSKKSSTSQSAEDLFE